MSLFFHLHMFFGIMFKSLSHMHWFAFLIIIELYKFSYIVKIQVLCLIPIMQIYSRALPFHFLNHAFSKEQTKF